MTKRTSLLLALLLGMAVADTALAAPRVVVSIKPVHALVCAVMTGVGTPELLIEGAGSPHGYSLRPSQAQSLARADLIVWVGHDLETFLARPLATYGDRAQVLELLAAPGLLRLPAREGGAWEAHTEGAPGHEEEHGGEIDPHLWLSPDNAVAILTASAEALAALDPAHAAHYRANRDRTAARVRALEADIDRRLAPVKAVPYIVFHDAYQYFEQAFGTRAVGAISVDPERRPGARRLLEIRRRIAEAGVRAVFAEPQFPPRLLATVVEGTPVRVGILDPLGADLPAGPESWFLLLERMTDALVATLGDGSTENLLR